MTQQKLYNQIREVRNKHFPPVLEFGCEVRIGANASKDKSVVCQEFTYCGKSDVWDWVGEKNGICCILKDGQKTPTVNIDLLGKPPTLQEVLMMIQPAYKYSIDGLGRFFEQIAFSPTDHENVKQKYLFTYDLTLPLQDQTPETLQAILNLIK